MGSQENFLGLVGWQNNNPSFRVGTSKNKKNIDYISRLCIKISVINFIADVTLRSSALNVFKYRIDRHLLTVSLF